MGEVGNRIKKYRLRKGYSISRLAEESGIAKSYISFLERDQRKNPSVETLKKLSKVLKIPLELLMVDEERESILEVLDDEWLGLIKEAKESGVSKEEVRNYIRFIQYNKWHDNKDSKNPEK
ncbi:MULTISPECIES: helix-turn-helix domain-containing protein [Alteribacter]|uniref:Helix-turn-helix domain-containing protein n=1 Tax=Alteribacter keqinensis TaxID=2483800 RepID=A0A3M7TM96_9BACI|nr:MULTISPECIES: helix-turn-helix domain-containing protein [Alteribacter]MBM7096775.1 helix-turn-helix domain-containing protein [Alteribacter salitolerans]RNA66310.1 helix-turn-helix domain-containing protein [Alteribacter keqinensis]